MFPLPARVNITGATCKMDLLKCKMRRFFATCIPRRRVQLVGLKEKTFYGSHGTETALNILKNSDGHLYVGVPEYEVQFMQPPENTRRIQPIKQIEKMSFSEFIPVVQASAIEKRKIRAL